MSSIRSERRGHIAVLTLNRPTRRNALSMELMVELSEAVVGLDDSVLGIVLTGSGGVFCAGADFEDLRTHGAGLEDALASLGETLERTPVPVVAAINGPCVGGGVELAMRCDIRVCERDAFFEIPATKLGVLYRPEGLRLLASRLPPQTVSRLFLVNDRIQAAEAVAAGMVVGVADGSSVDAALGLLDHQQDLQRDVVAATKRRLREIERDAVDVDGWNAERASFAERMFGA